MTEGVVDVLKYKGSCHVLRELKRWRNYVNNKRQKKPESVGLPTLCGTTHME